MRPQVGWVRSRHRHHLPLDSARQRARRIRQLEVLLDRSLDVMARPLPWFQQRSLRCSPEVPRRDRSGPSRMYRQVRRRSELRDHLRRLAPLCRQRCPQRLASTLFDAKACAQHPHSRSRTRHRRLENNARCCCSVAHPCSRRSSTLLILSAERLTRKEKRLCGLLGRVQEGAPIGR